VTSRVSLALATAAFVGAHLAMSHPLRAGVVKRVGERAFAGLYSLIAAIALIWMIVAWRAGDDLNPYWVAPLWWWPIASALMLAASTLLVGSLIGNPAFPRPGARPRAIPPPAGVFAITRHPMNWSFMLWALVHLSLSGSPRNLIVASGILLLGSAGSFGQDRKKERLLGESWREWEAQTSFIPFAALGKGRFGKRGLIALAGGAVLWALATSYHAPLVSPIGDLLSRGG
jgi:uncharacterized membrane protein